MSAILYGELGIKAQNKSLPVSKGDCTLLQGNQVWAITDKHLVAGHNSMFHFQCLDGILASYVTRKYVFIMKHSCLARISIVAVLCSSPHV